MDCAAWATLAAVLVALGIGVASLHQTKRIQQRQYRYGLLSEIIEWTMDIANWRFVHRKAVGDMLEKKDRKEQQLFLYAHIVEVKETFMGMRGRNQYVSVVAKEVFELSLQEAARKLQDEVEAYVEFLDNWQHAMADAIQKGIDDKQENRDKANQHEQQLDQYVDEVMREAARTKSRYIR